VALRVEVKIPLSAGFLPVELSPVNCSTLDLASHGHMYTNSVQFPSRGNNLRRVGKKYPSSCGAGRGTALSSEVRDGRPVEILEGASPSPPAIFTAIPPVRVVFVYDEAACSSCRNRGKNSLAVRGQQQSGKSITSFVCLLFQVRRGFFERTWQPWPRSSTIVRVSRPRAPHHGFLSRTVNHPAVIRL